MSVSRFGRELKPDDWMKVAVRIAASLAEGLLNVFNGSTWGGFIVFAFVATLVGVIIFMNPPADWYAFHSGWYGVSLITFGVVVAAAQIVRRDAGVFRRKKSAKRGQYLNLFSQLDPTVSIKDFVPNAAELMTYVNLKKGTLKKEKQKMEDENSLIPGLESWNLGRRNPDSTDATTETTGATGGMLASLSALLRRTPTANTVKVHVDSAD